MRRFALWCREHLTGYVPWPPLALSFIYGVGLVIALVLLMVIFGRVLPEPLFLIVFYSCCVLGPLGIGFLWLVGWIVANKWERTSAWAMLKLWFVWCCATELILPKSGATAPSSADLLRDGGLIWVPLVALFLVRAHYRRKWRGEVRPLDGTI
jgi:hypothetical protein